MDDNTTRLISHPLEDTLDIAVGTTEVDTIQSTALVAADKVQLDYYDDKDREIENQFDEVYNTAVTSALNSADAMEVVEGQYKARLGEVTASMLSVALSAAREKSLQKQFKDKKRGSSPLANPTSGTINNNIIVADRNELLRMLAGQNNIVDVV